MASPKAEDLPKAQRDYIQDYVQRLEDALRSDHAGGFQQRTYLDFIDRGSWIDHHIMNALTENADAFFRSAYMTKDRGDRIVAGPMWDNDRSMDGGDDRSKRTDVWNGEDGATPIWEYGWWGVLSRDPEFIQAWVDRWQTLRRTEFSPASLTTLVDTIAIQIGRVAAARDAARWPENASRFEGSWQGEINHMKSWLTQRVAWIDSQFTAPPSVTNSGGNIILAPVAGTQIVYTTDGSDPRSMGGSVSSLATRSSDPVTFASTLNVRARSYRADHDSSKIPGSPWSASVGTAPAITTQPANQTVGPGLPATFTVAASGTPATTFQWRRNGTTITGATNGTLSLSAVTAAAAGDYTVVVTNAAGSVTSSTAALTVAPPKSYALATIAAQPVAQTVGSGSTVVFTVAADGSPAPIYQWRRNGVNIANATGDILVVSAASATPSVR